MQELKERILACLSGLDVGESLNAEAIADEACLTLKEAYDGLDELLNERLVEQHAGIGKRDPTYTITKKGKNYRPGEADGTSVPDEAPPKVKKPDVTPGRTVRGRPPGKGRKKAVAPAEVKVIMCEPVSREEFEEKFGGLKAREDIPVPGPVESPCPAPTEVGEAATIGFVIEAVAILNEWVGDKGSLAVHAVLPFMGGTVTIDLPGK